MKLEVPTCQCAEISDEEKMLRISEMIEEYRGQEGNLIQVLHLAQAIYGCLPLEVQQFIADKLDISLSQVSGVTSFYSFFTTEPRGRHTISVCMGTACYVRGSTKILKRITDMLAVQVGKTTDDQRFTLEVMRCMGACGLAPAIKIDDDVLRQVNPDKLDAILMKYE